ncbi:hypothetical protein F5Y10DRAFT_267103 [Nemania abortiva]|nr:hypothetical protein F5Y10DRAFT_267103 [Nemania abortiva]
MAFTSNSRVMTLLRYCPYQVYSTLDRVCDEESGNTESSTIAAQLPKRDASKWTIRFCSSSRIDSIVRRAILALLPSPLSSLFGYGGPSFSSPSETAYLDGLRGIGALIVYTQHFAMPFHHGIIGDSSRETGSWSVLQYPIVRLFYHGSFAVSLFFVLSGFVLSRSILTTRHHNSSVISCTKATEAIASAAFRRGIRLFPPAIAVVFVTFILARLEAFEHPRLELPSNRYDLSTPEKLDSTIEQLGDAVTYVFSQLLYPAKWMRPVDLVSAQTYGFHLWTISVEFWASQLLFLALLATIRFTASARRQIFSLIIIYSFWCLRWELSLFLAGSLISDFHLLRETIQRSGSTVMARLIHYGVAAPALAGIEMEEVTFQNSFNEPSVYRGPPTPELEDAWHNLYRFGLMSVPDDKMPLLNKTASDGFERTLDSKGSGFRAMPDVLHQLHCLNTIRQYTWLQVGGHYGLDSRHNLSVPHALQSNDVGNRMHADHCIETLRKVLMCHSDVTPLFDTVDPANPLGRKGDFNVFTKCRSFSRLQDWLRGNVVIPFAELAEDTA